ncbi:MAG TPA: T9SS type A sorting domain-containing protein, partial [Cytophagaceae bacterium]|nr:T9SS type A sorting domain-containing protein [Cytophagaceae bacterium]
GNNGTNYGGGGGGNAGTGMGGNGAGGYVTITYSVSLAVTLVNFKGILSDNQAMISWTSLNEENILRYIVEVSPDAISFYPVDTVKTINTSKIQEYTSTIQLSQFSYVRLRIVELSGSVSFSDIISLGSLTTRIIFYPNPLIQGQSLKIETELAGEATLLNAQGVSVFVQNLHAGNNSIALGTLSAGIYFLELRDSSQQIKREQLIIY